MKTINEIKNEVALEQGYVSYLDVFEFAYALCDEVAKRYAAQLQPKWIKINSEADLPDKSQTVLVWQYNLSDPKSSRLQKAEYFSGIFKIYPRLQNGYFEAVNDFKAYDLEGDVCQITHWMPLPSSPI